MGGGYDLGFDGVEVEVEVEVEERAGGTGFIMSAWGWVRWMNGTGMETRRFV